MKELSIGASQKQLSRLRNGHRVRVKQTIDGMGGFNLLIDPAKFDSATRCFSKGTAYQMQLSPDEIMANKLAAKEGTMKGEGIFKCGGGKISVKGLPSQKEMKKELVKVGKESAKVGKVVLKHPVTKAVVKTAVPIIAEEGIKYGATFAGADPVTAKHLGKVGSAGAKAGIEEAYKGVGLYAGRGLYAGGLLGPPSRMPEVSSISIGGTLLGKSDGVLPPALRSQAMSANFHMNTQLPPHFQRGGIRFV